jgi:hypothetical protein
MSTGHVHSSTLSNDDVSQAQTYEPATQGRGAAIGDEQYIPTGHNRGNLKPAWRAGKICSVEIMSYVAIHVYPSGRLAHVPEHAAVVRPVLLPYVPTGQFEHVVAPPVEYVPELHF